MGKLVKLAEQTRSKRESQSTEAGEQPVHAQAGVDLM